MVRIPPGVLARTARSFVRLWRREGFRRKYKLASIISVASLILSLRILGDIWGNHSGERHLSIMSLSKNIGRVFPAEGDF